MGKKNDGKKNDGKKNDGKKNDGKKNDGKKNDGKKKNDGNVFNNKNKKNNKNKNNNNNNNNAILAAQQSAAAAEQKRIQSYSYIMYITYFVSIIILINYFAIAYVKNFVHSLNKTTLTAPFDLLHFIFYLLKDEEQKKKF